MASRPLFIIVAESIVILGPIRQVGWFKASFGPTLDSSSSAIPKNGPPEAVSRISRTSTASRPSRHWKMAECSESTGIMRLAAPLAPSASLTTQAPPATRDSLLARATVLPHFKALTVEARPAKPTIPLRTTSAGGCGSGGGGGGAGGL